MSIIVTGGAGFIGTNFILNRLQNYDEKIIVIDKLTYAGELNNFKDLKNNKNFHFIKCDISDSNLISKTLLKFCPRGLIHFAAETHVDNSIESPDEFIQTNIVGTFNLLKQTKYYYENLPKSKTKDKFIFLNVSTDEVYGSLNKNDQNSTEESRYKPNSPYSASKAAADHLVRSFFQTYSMPVITTHCSNNYGPYQNKEKLIPLIINNALKWEKIPIYGSKHIICNFPAFIIQNH